MPIENLVGTAEKSAFAGRPFMIGVQVAPPSVLLYMASPQNDEYSVVGACGSSRMSVAPKAVAGAGLISIQPIPPPCDSHRPSGAWAGGRTRPAPPRPRRRGRLGACALAG